MKSNTYAGQQYTSHPDFFPTSIKERQILASVLYGGAISQAQIGRETGTPQQSVSRLVNGLVRRGALKTGMRIDNGKRGQQSVTINLVPDFSYSFGVSIMPDLIHVSLLNFTGAVLAERRVYMTSMVQQNIIDKLCKLIRELTQEHIADPSRIFGIGVGASGYFSGRGSNINTPHLSDEWALVGIDDILSEQMQLPVWLENDGSAAAIGEGLVGAGCRMKNFVYLYVAAGLGGGVVIDGDLMRGAHGNVGDLALLLPEKRNPQPNLELLKRILAKHGVAVTTVSAMIEQFDPRWPGIDEWVSLSCESLSLIASACAAILDPEAIVLGGKMPKVLVERLIANISIFDNTRCALSRPMPNIVPAQAKGDACSVGAAMLPFKYQFFVG